MIASFRAILPSWKFFDRVGALPVFSYRADQGEWIKWIPQYKRDWLLFFNPHDNLTLAKVSLLERVLGDLNSEQNPEEYSKSVSYRLLEEWARSEIRQIHPDAKNFEFKLGFQDGARSEDVLISLESGV